MTLIRSSFHSLHNRLLTKYYSNKDFRTNRHIIVFESDDWGSIRMSNKYAFDELLKMGYAVDKRPYERFDTLESPKDLEALFNVLVRYKDTQGNHPIITANMLMVNPDFDKITQSGYDTYYYEPILETYRRYFGDDNVLSLMREGINEGVFMPQFHGREHFNVAHWMRGLQNGNEDFLTAFKFNMCGIAPKVNPQNGNQLMNALWANNEEEQSGINRIVADGLKMFERLWGFRSESFVAPCYRWNQSIERVLNEGGVRLIQTIRRNNPAYLSSSRYFYQGQHNDLGQTYSIRNCVFEPATNEGGSTVDSLINQVCAIFNQHKIAVFSTHRINYVSGIGEQNRERTLELLDGFLATVLRKYPDVEFISSNKLLEVL